MPDGLRHQWPKMLGRKYSMRVIHEFFERHTLPKRLPSLAAHLSGGLEARPLLAGIRHAGRESQPGLRFARHTAARATAPDSRSDSPR